MPGSEPRGTHRLTVPADRAGERLDRYLPEAIPGISRARGQRLIAEGNVRVAGKPARPSTRLSGGEPIVVVVPPPALRGTAIVSVPLAEATARLKTVDDAFFSVAEVFFG